MSSHRSSSGGSGIGLGCVIAVAISYSINHSIGWAFLHGVCGWFYMLYVLFGGGR